MILEEFIKQRYPEIIEEFERFNRKEILPPIGSRVKPLGNGYGMNSQLTVIAHVKAGDKTENGSIWGGNYIVLQGCDGEYLSDQEDWWKELKINS